MRLMDVDYRANTFEDIQQNIRDYWLGTPEGAVREVLVDGPLRVVRRVGSWPWT